MSFVNIKKILPFIIVFLLLLLIKNITLSIIKLQKNSHIVYSLKQQEEKEKKREQFLKERFYYVKTDEFVENEAREKLGMVKEGEKIVLAPPMTKNAQKTEPQQNDSNWTKWRKLFF